MNLLQDVVLAEGQFGSVALMAAALGRVPISGVALLRDGVLRLRDVVGMPPLQQAELLPLCRQTVEADDMVVFAQVRRSKGRVVHYFAGIPIRSDDRRPVGVVFIAAHDARHLESFVHDALWVLGHQIERELQAQRAQRDAGLLKRVAASAHQATDVRTMLGDCLNELCAHLRWPLGHVYLSDGEKLVPSGLWHGAEDPRFARLRDITESAPIPVGTGLPGEVAATSRPKWMDCLGLPEIGISSAFAFPVCVDDSVIAVVELFHDEYRPPSPRLLDLASALGGELGRAAGWIALRDTERRLREIVDATPDAFAAVDGEGAVTEWNAAAERMFGWSRGEILGRSLTGTIGITASAGVSTAVRANGQEFPVELEVRPCGEGTVLRAHGEPGTRNFIAAMAHELRTPLTSVAGYMELLVDEELTTEQREMALIVQRNTQRVQRLVEDVVTVGKIDARELRLTPEPADLGPLVAGAVGDAEPVAVRKAINLVSQIGPDPVPVLADPDQLGRALRHLLDNAIELTPPAGAVAIRVRRVGDEARITLADTGVGLTDEELPMLFTRFFRPSLALGTDARSTGLGLVIAKHVVELHRGRVTARSRAGQGTMITVVLPIVTQP
ncbi:hypothetical protein Lesp02_23310 [Lentzea sp. NBRC 105346]|uniref:ATP-binding protein n=1 Tax=Lentzea sp. NBRC 105346 TaxID=3032205 RepID=UPI0024A21FB0|nr:ATP-binding protein [Lentzea sp. NBRC 105346]GLZ30141.1 hypothetical protein Lesp02_23310 [Lentzea sp. NBRC 105346]